MFQRKSLKEYYQELGLPDNSSIKEVKKAYHKLALQHHPDKNPDDKAAAAERFKKIQTAYEALTSAPKPVTLAQPQTSQPQPTRTYSANTFSGATERTYGTEPKPPKDSTQSSYDKLIAFLKTFPTNWCGKVELPHDFAKKNNKYPVGCEDFKKNNYLFSRLSGNSIVLLVKRWPGLIPTLLDVVADSPFIELFSSDVTSICLIKNTHAFTLLSDLNIFRKMIVPELITIAKQYQKENHIIDIAYLIIRNMKTAPGMYKRCTAEDLFTLISLSNSKVSCARTIYDLNNDHPVITKTEDLQTLVQYAQIILYSKPQSTFTEHTQVNNAGKFKSGDNQQNVPADFVSQNSSHASFFQSTNRKRAVSPENGNKQAKKTISDLLSKPVPNVTTEEGCTLEELEDLLFSGLRPTGP